MIRFTQLMSEKRVTRYKPIFARMEERLTLVLDDPARETDRTVGEVLKEIVLHSFEPNLGQEGVAVPNLHEAETFRLIERLQNKHGVDYDTHANYSFVEEHGNEQQDE